MTISVENHNLNLRTYSFNLKAVLPYYNTCDFVRSENFFGGQNHKSSSNVNESVAANVTIYYGNIVLM